MRAHCVNSSCSVDRVCYDRAYGRQKQDGGRILHKGLSHLQEKNYEMASVEFNRSLQYDSTYKRSYYGLGIINDYQGKIDEAAKYYQKAIDQDDEFSEAHNALGVVYSKQKNI